jgi:hypothetical protein
MSVAHSCVRCGERKSNAVTIFRDDTLVASGCLCEWCLAAACAEVEILRGQFRDLLDAGLSREAANAIMVARVAGRIPVA